MLKKINFIQKNLVWFIPALMSAGLAYGYYFNAMPLKVLILPFTFLMVYPMMVNLQIKKILNGVDYKLQLTTQAINFLLVPFAGFAIGNLFFPDDPLIVLGLLLASLLPTSGMTISWTGFSKGNINAAIKMTVIGLILGSLATPLYAKFLMGETIAIPLFNIFKQIALIVFLPMVLGFLTQRGLIAYYGEAKYQKDLKQIFPPLANFGVLGIVFVAMALKSQSIIANPYIFLSMLVPLIILYTFNFAFSSLIGKYFFSRADGIALVYGTVMRNLSIALAIAMTAFGSQGSDIAIIVAMAYIIQVQSAAWYVKISPKIFGPAPEDTAEHAMKEGIFSLPVTATLRDASKLLDEEHIHSAAVHSESNELVGVISQDKLINLLAQGKELETSLSEVELDPIIKFSYDAPLSRIIQSMQRNHEYKVFIVDKKGNYVGVVSEGDVLKSVSAYI
jgi:ACR3 family arsenite efflux pump ArsB/CBS domain-containing protein